MLFVVRREKEWMDRTPKCSCKSCSYFVCHRNRKTRTNTRRRYYKPERKKKKTEIQPQPRYRSKKSFLQPQKKFKEKKTNQGTRYRKRVVGYIYKKNTSFCFSFVWVYDWWTGIPPDGTALNAFLLQSTLFINTVFPHQFTWIVPPLGNWSVKKIKINEITVPLSIAALVT